MRLDEYEQRYVNAETCAAKGKGFYYVYNLCMRTSLRRSLLEISFSAVPVAEWKKHVNLVSDVYYYNENELCVAQYVPSRLNWQEKGISITQTEDFYQTEQAEFMVKTAKPQV